MKKPRSVCVTAILALAFCLMTGALQAQEVREFTNSAGNKISGTILSATDTDVTMKLADGREITGGVNFFSKDDQAYITKWRKLHPEEFTYDFNVTLSRDRTKRDERNESHTVVTYEDWRFKVTIENRSKAGRDGTDLENLELHYNLVKTARAKADDSRSLHAGMVSYRQNLVKAGKVSIGKIGYLRDVELVTETIPINKSELESGYYYTDGTKDERKDDFEGIDLRIVKDGKVIYEDKSGSKDVKTNKWVEPGGDKK